MQGINIIYAITIGNKIVQHTDINWSKRILGKEALAQINTNIKKQVLSAKIKLNINPSTNGLYSKVSRSI